MTADSAQLSMEDDLVPAGGYRGYVLAFDIDLHQKTFTGKITRGEPFQTIFNLGRLEVDETGMCLISTADPAHVSHAALIRKVRGREATLGSNVRVSEYVRLAPGPVSLRRLSRLSGVSLTDSVAASSARPGRAVEMPGWTAVLAALAKLAPESAAEVAALDARCRRMQRERRTHGLEIMAMQRDAVGLVLDFTGLDRAEILQNQMPMNPGEPRPALDLLRRRTVREEDLLARDMKVFGDWLRLDQLESKRNVVHFQQKGGATVTVFSAHRNELEETTGVDLIYFHDRFNSFVMVQYKRVKLDKEGRNGVYRFDGSYEDEIERMRRLRRHALLNQDRTSLNDYRLHGDAFYFKLCDPLDIPISPRDLVPGTYFPLELWDWLLQNGFGVGKRKGRALHPEGVRNLNNTLFVNLVRDGWVGSVSRGVQDLDALVEESLAEGRSVIGARKH